MRYQWTHQFIAMASHSCVVRAAVDRPSQPDRRITAEVYCAETNTI